MAQADAGPTHYFTIVIYIYIYNIVLDRDLYPELRVLEGVSVKSKLF